MIARSGLRLFLRGTYVLLIALFILFVDFDTLPSPEKIFAGGFSAQRAAVDIQQVAETPHPAGSSSHKRVEQELVEKLRALGLTPSLQQSIGITEVANLVAATPVSNILACVPGTSPSGSVLLTAHYDSVQTGPGASDDGAGVATILETLRALHNSAPLNNDVLVLFTDGEEHSLAGAEAFASTYLNGKWAGPCSAPRIDLNFDNRGDRGPVYLFETGPRNAALIRAYARTPNAYGSSLFAAAYSLIPNNTDFSIFKNAGLTGLNFAMVDGFQTYHTALDTADRVDRRSVQQIGSNTVALLLNLGNARLDKLTTERGEAVFFNPLAGWMVRYPMAWSWPLEVLSGIFLILALYLSRQELRPLSVLATCFAVAFSCILTATFTGFGAVLLLRHAGDRLLPGQTTSNLLLLCSLVAASLAVLLVLRRGWASVLSVPSMGTGVLLVLWGLSLLTTAQLPGGSFLFLWPTLWLLLINVTFKLSRWSAFGEWSQFLKNVVAILPALLLFLPLLWQAYILLGISLPVAAFFGAMLALLVFMFPEEASREGHRWSVTLWTAAGLLFTAAVLILSGVLLSRSTAASPRPDSLALGVNLDTKQAAWISFDQVVDPWTSRTLGTTPQHAARPDLLGDTFGEVFSKEAPFKEVKTMSVTSHTLNSADGHTLELQLQPGTPGERLQLTWNAEHSLTGLTIADRTIDLDVGNHQFGNLGLQTTPRRVELFGVPTEGIHVTLTWRSNAPKHVTLLEYVSGLAAFIPAAPTTSPAQSLPPSRPADHIPATGDDIGYVLRTLPSD